MWYGLARPALRDSTPLIVRTYMSCWFLAEHAQLHPFATYDPADCSTQANVKLSKVNCASACANTSDNLRA